MSVTAANNAINQPWSDARSQGRAWAFARPGERAGGTPAMYGDAPHRKSARRRRQHGKLGSTCEHEAPDGGRVGGLFKAKGSDSCREKNTIVCAHARRSLFASNRGAAHAALCICGKKRRIGLADLRTKSEGVVERPNGDEDRDRESGLDKSARDADVSRGQRCLASPPHGCASRIIPSDRGTDGPLL